MPLLHSILVASRNPFDSGTRTSSAPTVVPGRFRDQRRGGECPRTQVRARTPRRTPAPLPPPADVPANGPHAPAPCARLDGTSHYRTSARRNRSTARTRRSSRAGHSRNFFSPAACDGPRKAASRRPQNPSHPRRDVPDTGVPAPDAAGARPRSGGIPTPHANETSNEQPDGRSGCNTGSAGEKDETDAHTLSAGNAAAAPEARSQPEARGPLDEGTNSQHAQRGPREGSLPNGQVSERSVNFSPRRSCITSQPTSPSRVIGHPVACHTRQATP
jgi:hypothetical protein